MNQCEWLFFQSRKRKINGFLFYYLRSLNGRHLHCLSSADNCYFEGSCGCR